MTAPAPFAAPPTAPAATASLRRLVPERTALLVVDVQEKLAGTMPAQALADLRRSLGILLGAAREFSLATLFTEQYPRGLGPTEEALRRSLEEVGARRFEKTCFSAAAADGFAEALPREVDAVVVVGMETHVCVFQTVRDLVTRGLAVHVPLDGVASRRDDHRQVGLELCRRAGAVVTTTETVVFDWLERSGTPRFKALAPLIR
jgi:nicotinamidase-related amidase